MADDIAGLAGKTSTTAGLDLQRQLLAALATDKNIPSGILHRCAAYSSRIRDFTGNVDSPACTQGEWDNLYHEVVFGRHHGRDLMPLDAVAARAAAHLARGLTPILVADFDFEIVRPRFWTAIQRHLASGQSADAFPLADQQIDQVLESRHALFATTHVRTEYGLLATMPRVHRGLAVNFILPRDGYLSNRDDPLTGVEVDFGLGAGYQAVAYNDPIAVQYTEPGPKIIRLRGTNTLGVQHAKFGIEIALATAPPVDATWTLTGYQPYQGNTAQGHAWVYYGSVNGTKKTSLTDPVIVAEGFPGNYSLDYLWDRLNQQNLANNMLAEGKDLIILGFADGTLPIQANAFVAVTCINRAISERTGSKLLLVGGASMGGLVTRYALTFMEKNNLPHQTARYFTIDSPHGGANISPSVQAFIQYISVYQASAAPFAAQLASPAAQQMLLMWIPPYSAWNSSGMTLGQSPLRSQFIADLQSIGWMPRQPVSAAIADGVGSGAQNGDTPGALAVDWGVTACIWDNSFVYPLGGNTVTFAKMEVSKVDALVWTFWANNGPGYDSIPGGLTDTFGALYDTLPSSKNVYFRKACFIPTVSACALSAGYYQPITPGVPSDFNRYKFSSSGNLDHIELSPELAAYVADFIRGN